MMERMLEHPPVQYIVREDGRRTGVVLGWEDYQDLRVALSGDPDLLPGLKEAELQVLAEGMLSSHHQERLNGLLQRNRAEELDADEERELEGLLERVDYMNTLKARAMYTLHWLCPGRAGEIVD